MKFLKSKKLILIILLSSCIFLIQATTQQQNKDHNEKAVNLKVLPKNISSEELHNLMKVFSKSLGVHCGECHAQRKDDATKLDFASDEKMEKTVARKMMLMTADINKKYISKIGDHHLESVACVTCHMGHLTPVVSVDSLMKK